MKTIINYKLFKKIMGKRKKYRKFAGKRFKRYTSYGNTLTWNKKAVKSFKRTNKDKYFIRTIKRSTDSYEFYLKKK